MKADIMACYGNTLLDRMIRSITGKEVTHVTVVLDEDHMIDTGWLGVKISLISSKPNYYLLRAKLTSDQQDKIVEFVQSKLSYRYDYKLMIGIALNRIFGLHTNWDNPNKYICIELIIEAYRSVGIELVVGIDDEDIVPGDLLDSKKLAMIKEER